MQARTGYPIATGKPERSWDTFTAGRIPFPPPVVFGAADVIGEAAPFFTTRLLTVQQALVDA